ncbi:MAG: 4a-hydroxytetrahydrobiopterin dehydratase [Ilumatobacteraceae bacterium]
MRYVPLEDEAARAMPELASWTVAEKTISREFRLRNFAVIADFIRDVIEASERLNHHPDLDIRYPNAVLVRMSTHVVGGLSNADVTLATEIDSIAQRH